MCHAPCNGSVGIGRVGILSEGCENAGSGFRSLSLTEGMELVVREVRGPRGITGHSSELSCWAALDLARSLQAGLGSRQPMVDAENDDSGAG